MSHSSSVRFTLPFLIGGLLVLSGCLKTDNTPTTGSGSVVQGSSSSLALASSSSSSAMSWSSSSVMVIDLSSSSSSMSLVRADALSITQTPERKEVQPGSEFTLAISIANRSNQALSGLQVESAFPVSKISVVDPTSGTLQGDRVLWTIDSLEPNQVRNIRFRAKVNDTLPHGESILNIVTVRSGSLPFPLTSTQEISVIQKLPRTGAGDFVSPLDDTSKYVTPYKN